MKCIQQIYTPGCISLLNTLQSHTCNDDVIIPDNWHQYSQRMAVCSSSSSISKERKHLSLSLEKRRKIVVVDEEGIENSKKPMVPQNTRKATDWAVAVFKQWIEQHNIIAENKCPVDILKDEPDNLAHWLCVFVNEIRKDDGDFYTPRSITQILGGLQRF